jgi:competence protein ComEC
MVGIVLILGIAALVLQPQTMSQGGSVSMLDIGQGDSFLIQAANGAQLLIDGGRDAKVLSELAKVMPAGDRSIDVVIATHPDADHIGGLPLVLERYKVGLFLTSQVTTDTQVFKDLYKTIAQKNIPAYYVRSGMTLSLDPATHTALSILFPDRDTSGWETNTASVVARLDIGTASALFTGDSPSSIEKYLIKKEPSRIDVDILKLGHHGSKNSSSAEFLEATSPTLALISAGVNNKYGHPHKEVIDLLAKLHIPYVSTQMSGTVTLRTDGVSWKTQSEK